MIQTRTAIGADTARATVRLIEEGFRVAIFYADGEKTGLDFQEYKDARDFITEKGIANKNQ